MPLEEATDEEVDTLNTTDPVSPDAQSEPDGPVVYPPMTLHETEHPNARPKLPRFSRPLQYACFVAVILGAIAYLFVSLLINHLQIKDDSALAPTRRAQDLVNLLKQAEDKKKQLEVEAGKLRQTLLTLQKNPARAGEDLPAPDNPEYQKMLKMSGLTPLKGEGIIITLQEPSDTLQKGPGKKVPDSKSNIQSDDLLKLVNDLKAAGAHAVSINGQRLVTSSEIVNSGSSIVVNQTRISSPIEIKAIGKPAILHASLKLRGGILEYLEFFGITSHIREEKELSLPAYTGSISQ